MCDSSGSGPDAAATLIELNVGGIHYTTNLKTLQSDQDSLLVKQFSQLSVSSTASSSPSLPRDAKGRVFIDRDGVLFRYILDYLRDGTLVLPEGFREGERLKQEALHFNLNGLVKCVADIREQRRSGCITVGYRGSFQFGKDGLADVKFRKLSRILVCGRVALCREVFADTLNESRDPDHGGPDRYTSRFFLKHCFIEQAFDMLQEQGFRLTGSCGSGTAGAAAELKPGVDVEENRWNHYNEFVFIRD